MKNLVTILLAGTVPFFFAHQAAAGNSPETPASVNDSRDDFLPDFNFSGKVYQVTANPIIWSDDRSLAVIYDETASGAICYTFWCLKRNAQGNMVPIAKYRIWTDLLKKGILLDDQGLTVMLEGSRGLPGRTNLSHHFPFKISQASISFLRKGQEHLNSVGGEDLEEEWKQEQVYIPAASENPKRELFLPDINFSSKVYQCVSSKPVLWNDDRPQAVVWEEGGTTCSCYIFWCLKRNAQRIMVPVARYTIWTDLLKKGILLDDQGLTVILEGSRGLPGTTSVSHHFPFTVPQAQISFLQDGQEHLNGVENEDLEKEWKKFLAQ